MFIREYDEIDYLKSIKRLIQYCEDNKYKIEKVDIKNNCKVNEVVIVNNKNETENIYCTSGIWNFDELKEQDLRTFGLQKRR